jgi:phage terminase small subunit
MKHRGRKSAAELSTISGAGVAIIRRPDPPAHLGEDAATIWRATVNSLPADWLGHGAQPLLAAFCALTVSQQFTIRALQRIEDGDDEFSHPGWAELQNQLGQISGRVATLATRLRLTPQSRYGARSADTAARNEATGPPPWEE